MLLAVGPYLFVDDYFIQHQSGLIRRVNQPRRLPEPVVTGPEDKCFQPYVTVLRDPESGRFRIWYGIPESAGQTHLAHMWSEDGIHWIRPHQVLRDPAFVQFGASIIDEGPGFAAKDKRYKYAFWAGGGTWIATSPDGMEWKPIAPKAVLPHDHDITSIFWDPIRKRYSALVSSYTTGKSWKGNRRVPMQSVSGDLVHWRKPWRIIEPDEKDDGETQFYCMSGVVARGGLLIGLLKVLRDEVVAEGAPEGAYGIGYTVLAWSRDGKTWKRDREPFLPRDPRPGAWDHAMAWGDCQLIVGSETRIYYGGYAWGHKHERFSQRQIGLARMPVDRYVSRDANGKLATLRTTPGTLQASNVTVNARVDGKLRVRVLDRTGRSIEGLDYADCTPITGDSVAHAVKWKGRLASLKGSEVSFEFAFDRGSLYGFALRD